MCLAAPAGLLACGCRSAARGPSGWPLASPAIPRFFEHDGVGLAELIRTRQITPGELVEETLRQVEALNPSINAVIQTLFDPQRARDRAARASGQGPLAGVPLMLKNLTGYRSARIDFGSRLYARARARGTGPRPRNSSVVSAIEGAGMIVTGITNSAELGLIDSTEPVLHGSTRNPWNPAYTAGGSSGGSAAVVAARIVPLAHGNDGAGSIRIPAAHCGVLGFKPSRGREVGSGSSSAALDISSEFCLSRSVRDTAAFLSVVEKREDSDLPPVGFVEGPSARRLRIALWTHSLRGAPPDPEVERGVRSAAGLCEELGHAVEEAPPAIDGGEFMDAFIGLWATATLRLEPLVAEWLGARTDPADVLEPWTVGLMTLAKQRGPAACILRAMEAFAQVSARMEALFGDHDVLLSPVLRVPPFRLGVRDPTRDFGMLLERFLDDVAYTPLQNAAGMPGVSIPLHWTADGLPVGVQFSAWRGQERTLLELAYELELARPWSGRTPPIAVR